MRGLFSPSLKGFLRVSFKGAEDQIQQERMKISSQFNFEKFKTWSGSTNLQKTVYSKT
ncbi:hypothetical protein WUMEUNZI_CDS0031 [Salmonella phage SeKF_63]|uniref:Uncharacterized protein n=1 Tax=Escherichia phage L27 TaxID=2562890 RepID=A0A455XD96_9CAUD|nr:hypothetical protein [Escherichia phage vB_EcoM_LMP34]QBQ76259.1 hypothetical protein [Escherichia phage vB_EcoM_LMP33]BBJ27057.1 hypothetical protein [Escherichia phage L27]